MVLLPGELEALQAAMLETFPLTADIQRNPNVGAPVKGTIPDEWPSILPDGPVSCGMKQPSAVQAQTYAALIGSMESTIFSFPDGQDVQRFDRVVVNSTTWTVAAPLTPQSYSVSTQVLATRLV